MVHYCENGALSIDNNLSELMVRPVAIGRKNYLLMGRDDRGKAAVVLDSIMASAKTNQVELFTKCGTDWAARCLGCDAASGRPVSAASAIPSVLVAVSGRPDSATPRTCRVNEIMAL